MAISLREKTSRPGVVLKSGGVDSILASLFQSILVELGVNAAKFNVLMEQFLSDHRNQLPENIRDKSNVRGNLRKELLKPHMTWKVFCKGLRFLNISRFEIAITLHHSTRPPTTHSKIVNLKPGDLD